MKKRLLACLLAACMAVSMLVLPASAASLNNSAIQTAITLGAMDTSQTGSLDAAVTRGAFAKMLVSFSAYRESASQQGNLGTLYKDVPGSSQWAPYVRIAVQQGWMNGYTDGSFRPNENVTRVQLAAMLFRFAQYQSRDIQGRGDLNSYQDSSSVQAWAKEAIQWAVAKGLISGKSGARLDPSGSATRAEAAAVLVRFLRQS